MQLAFDRKGSGPPLVLLHGVGHRRQAWDAVADLLTPHRDLIIPDLPGHGESPSLRAGCRPVLDVLLEAVTGLLADLGLDRPHMAGNSLGGRLALEAAAAGRTAGVTALSPAGFFRGRGDLQYSHAMFKTMQAAGRSLRPLLPVLAGTAAGRGLLYGAIVSRPSRLTPEQALGDIEAFLASKPALEAVLAGLGQFRAQIPADVPVTIAWGSKDRLLSRRQALVAKDQLPRARFVLLPGCGHVPMTDDPELVARVLIGGSSHAG